MLKIKVMLDEPNKDSEMILDELQTLLKSFKEICCAEGEALIFYIHACLEKEINKKYGRKDQNIDLTLMLLQRRIAFVQKEIADQVVLIVQWVLMNTNKEFRVIPDLYQLSKYKLSKNKATSQIDKINYSYNLLIPIIEANVCVSKENF